MSTAVIVQTRMGSTRLPGKVMLDIEGKPLIHRCVERLRMAKKIDDIIIATPDGDDETPLISYCESKRWKCYRHPGSANDVLGRYLGAARAYGVDIIVRVTSDCPLLDPGVLDGLVKMYVSSPDLDFVTNNVKLTFPHGLDAEVFSTESLAKLDKIEPNMSVREHCGTWRFRNDKAHFRVGNLECQKDLSGYRLTVDYEEDLTMAREIYKALKTRPVITTQDVIWLIDRRPDLQALMRATKLRFKYAATAPVVSEPTDERPRPQIMLSSKQYKALNGMKQ